MTKELYQKIVMVAGKEVADKAKQYTYNDNQNLLSGCFVWSDTFEGHNFWEKISIQTHNITKITTQKGNPIIIREAKYATATNKTIST
jgi:hypothetical protein